MTSTSDARKRRTEAAEPMTTDEELTQVSGQLHAMTLCCARLTAERDDALAQVAAVAELAENSDAAMDLWWQASDDGWPVPEDLPGKFLSLVLQSDPATVLARRDAEVAARALREAADEYGTPGMAAATPYVIGWLKDRAAHIARTGGAS